MKHKDEIHKVEDPDFLDSLSDILDVRNWNLSAFDPESDTNEKDAAFEEESVTMLSKLNLCHKFCCDLDMDELGNEMQQTLRCIYESEKTSKNLSEAKQKKHIIDQWTYLRGTVMQFSEDFQPLWFRLVKRGAASPNAQSGSERANSIYNDFKTDLSSTMKLPKVIARLRIKINGPPLSKHHPKAIRNAWIAKGHQYAETATKNKVVIERIRDCENVMNKLKTEHLERKIRSHIAFLRSSRKEAAEYYTSKVFD